MPNDQPAPPAKTNHVKVAGKSMPLPRNQIVRMALGGLLVVFGVLGFLPILGFWMIPLGLLILSVDIPLVRRWRRRFSVWWQRKVEAFKARRGR